MEKFISEIDVVNSTEYYTPAKLAFDLVIGEIDKTKAGQLVEISLEELLPNNILTFKYELLLTIFMEMFFYLAKIDHYAEFTTEYVPNYNSIDINTYISKIADNFEFLGYYSQVEIENLEKFAQDKDGFNFLVKNRYCRVVLKNNNENNENIDNNGLYQMKLNGLNEIKYSDLNQIYSLIFVGENVICIKFLKI